MEEQQFRFGLAKAAVEPHARAGFQDGHSALNELSQRVPSTSTQKQFGFVWSIENLHRCCLVYLTTATLLGISPRRATPQLRFTDH